MSSQEPPYTYGTGFDENNHNNESDDHSDTATETSRLQREEFDIDDRLGPNENLPLWAAHQRHYLESLVSWTKGPKPSKRQVIKPWIPSLHEAPRVLHDRYFPSRGWKVGSLIGFYLLWTIAFWSAVVYWKNAPLRNQPDYGMPVKQLDCGDNLWFSRNGCGLDGELCGPFNGSFAFRCPPGCKSYRLLNPRAVGMEEVNYQPLVVGGPTYRGDSFICAAAIHAGLFVNSAGGCSIAKRVGGSTQFQSSTFNGIPSIAFNSSFPLAFNFQDGSNKNCNGQNLQWPLLAMSIFFSIILSLVTTSPAVLFYSAFIGIFVQVGIVSDPPQDGSLPLASLFSILLGRLLPAMFCAVIIYQTCVKTTLNGLEAQIDKTALWLGGFWFGALSNYTFGWIPISRLTSHDLEQQPGAKVALAAIILCLLLVVFQQIYYFRLEGRLPQYFYLYGIMSAAIIIALLLPGLELRIHHYIIGLLLLPGTSIQTRPSLLYQGIMIGLFINGIARWGFASVLQTAAALRSDGQFGSLLPVMIDPIISLQEIVSNITFQWNVPDIQLGFDGISVLVNDVERSHLYFDEHIDQVQFVWNRRLPEPLYFRFAYILDRKSLDYTKAGLWKVDGSWRPMDPGPSR